MKDPKAEHLKPSSSPSSPTSSDFEFIISLSPTSRKSSLLCPADDLFYKGQLLPLQPSHRLSMVRTLLSSSSTSSSSDTATASRDSTGSSTSSDLSLLAELDSSRPSSATQDDEFKKPPTLHPPKKSNYFSLSKFSSVFLRKDNVNSRPKRITTSAKEVIRKYVKKVKPLYEKFTPKQSKMASNDRSSTPRTDVFSCNGIIRYSDENCSQSFSGNLRYPQRRRCIVSCPSSMRSSPTHPSMLRGGGGGGGGVRYSNPSTSEELQSAIEGAITHCKNSMNEFKDKKEGE